MAISLNPTGQRNSFASFHVNMQETRHFILTIVSQYNLVCGSLSHDVTLDTGISHIYFMFTKTIKTQLDSYFSASLGLFLGPK